MAFLFVKIEIVETDNAEIYLCAKSVNLCKGLSRAMKFSIKKLGHGYKWFSLFDIHFFVYI